MARTKKISLKRISDIENLHKIKKLLSGYRYLPSIIDPASFLHLIASIVYKIKCELKTDILSFNTEAVQDILVAAEIYMHEFFDDCNLLLSLPATNVIQPVHLQILRRIRRI